MSRVGKKPIAVPKDVEAKIEGAILTVKGPKGTLQREIHPGVRVSLEGTEILVHAGDESKEGAALHGLFRALIANMVTGVAKGFERSLEIVGVGYRAELNGRTAVFNIGYSHPVHFELPEGIEAKIERTKITLSGIDKELLGLTAARIRKFRKPEPYKGKGIKFSEEVIRRKAGKAGSK
jgi:large subunit ribosomal protein L6